MAEDLFHSLKRQIEEELHSVGSFLSSLTDKDVTESVYMRLSRQFDHIQNLFDDVSVANKDLKLDQSNPDFYNLLKDKEELNVKYGQFNRLRGEFFNRFSKFRKKHNELDWEHFLPERQEVPEEEAEVPEDEIPVEEEEEEFFDEEEPDPDEEKKAKAAARKQRQQKLAAEARKRDAQNEAERHSQEVARQAEQRRQEEARRTEQSRQENARRDELRRQEDSRIEELRRQNASRVDFDTLREQHEREANRYRERMFQDEQRRQSEDQSSSRIESENEALRRTRERVEDTSHAERIRYGHVDLSQETPKPSNDSQPERPAPSDRPYESGTRPGPAYSTPEYSTRPTGGPQPNQPSRPQPGYSEDRAPGYVPTPGSGGSRPEHDSSEPSHTPGHIPGYEAPATPIFHSPETSHDGTSVYEKLSHSGDSRHSEQDIRREEARHKGYEVREGQTFSEADLHKERVMQDTERVQKEVEASERIHRQNEAMRKTRERQEQSAQFGHLDNSHIDMSQEGIGRKPAENTHSNNVEIPSGRGPESQGSSNRQSQFTPGMESVSKPSAQEQDSYRPWASSAGQSGFRPVDSSHASNAVYDKLSHGQSHSSNGFKPHQFTPGGVSSAEPTPLNAEQKSVWSATADSNAKIYSALMRNREEAKSDSLKVSPAFETQMKFNLEHAHQKYVETKGTPAAVQAAHDYLQQRNALYKYQNAVKRGDFSVDKPTVTSPVASQNKDKGTSNGYQGTNGNAAVFSFTPHGTTGQTIANGQSTGNRFEMKGHGSRVNGKPAFSPDNPMVVTPAYEAAINKKMHSVKESLGSAMANGDPKAHSIDPIKAKMYQDAYLGFQAAKKNGSVVVKPEGEVSGNKGAANVPDFVAWQQRHYAQSMPGRGPGNGPGVTGHSKDGNTNRVSSKMVAENTADILNRQTHLKNQSIVKIYAGQIGGRIENHMIGAASSLSRHMYRLMQKGEDNPLQTLESGRYYITTAAGVVLAISAGAPTSSLRHSVKRASSTEFNLYGTKSLLTDKQLSSLVNNGNRLTRELDVKISDLESKLKNTNLSSLDRNRLSKELEKLKGDRVSAGKNLELNEGLKKLRLQTKAQEEFLKELKDAKGNLPKSPKNISEALRKMNEKANLEMSEKYKRIIMSGKKGFPLYKITDESLAEELTLLKKEGKLLKDQIKALEAKGLAGRSAAENSLLAKLKAKKDQITKEIGELSGLQKMRADLGMKNSFGDKIIKNAYKKRGRISGGLYALQGFMLRGLQAGYESNTDGMAKLLEISTNRYVHKILKRAYRASAFVVRTGVKVALPVVKAGMEVVVPGSVNAVTTATNAVKVAAKAQIGAARAEATAVKNAIKSSVKFGAKTLSQTVVNAVPTGIKTQVKTARSTITSTVDAYKKFILDKKLKFAQSGLGKGLEAFNRYRKAASEALKAALAAAKRLLLKAAVGFAAVFLLVGIFSVVAAGGLTGPLGAVILSPDSSADGKVDLTKYMDIIAEREQEMQSVVVGYMNDSKYDNVTVNYAGGVSNVKEMLSMMAVRMGQDLDISKNPEVEQYLISLYNDSHVTATTETYYECAGCEERTIWVDKLDPVTGQPVLNPATGEPIQIQETETYCPGHYDLEVSISVLKFDEIFGADTYANAGQNAQAGDLIGNFTITYYCCEKYPHICNGGPPYKTASGTTPTPGRTIAVDPNVIPLGTHVVINGHEYVAEDTGGAINQNRIDIAVATHKEALSKGIQNNVPVYNPSYEGGSYEETGVWEGWTDENKDWAHVIYDMDWSELYTGYYEFTGIVTDSGDGGNPGIFNPDDFNIDGEFNWPVPSSYQTVTSPFGMRLHPVYGTYKMHKGIDISVPTGTPVVATAPGTVIGSAYAGDAGNLVTIDHGNGILSKYMHNSSLVAHVGQHVNAGDLIAYSGSTGASTGPHLHFQIEVNGTPVDPLQVVTR